MIRTHALGGLLLVVALALGCSSSTNAPAGPGVDAGEGSPDGGLCFGGFCDTSPSGGTDTGGSGWIDAAPTSDTGATPTPDTPGPGTDVPEPTGCTGHDQCPDGELCIGGSCRPEPTCEETGTCPPTSADIEVSPREELWFSYVPGESVPVEKVVRVANTGEGPLELLGVALLSGTPPDFAITEPLADQFPMILHPGDIINVEITFTETSLIPGEGTLAIRSDDPDEGEIWVPLRPQPKGPVETPEPCIRVTPTNLNFGPLERGRSATLLFTIESCGTAALSLFEIKRGAGFFGVGMPEEFQLAAPFAAPTTLAPGQRVTQPVTFTAGLAGMQIGYFEVISSDPDQGTVRVDVSGESLPPSMETQGLHLQLEWDSNDTDVDLHLVGPGGNYFAWPGDCYFSNMQPDWGVTGDFVDDPFLDVDNVWGYGPENINLQEPAPGTYRVIIHFYSDSYGSSFGSDTRATVRIFFYGTLAGEFGPTYLETTDWRWDVADIEFPSQRITPLGNVYYDSAH